MKINKNIFPTVAFSLFVNSAFTIFEAFYIIQKLATEDSSKLQNNLVILIRNERIRYAKLRFYAPKII